jgi:hypothetical protein
MKRNRFSRRRLLANASIVATVLASGTIMMVARGDAPPAVSDTTKQLGGADRFLTFVSTDKPVYRPGERMYVRAAVLHAATHAPNVGVSPAAVEVIGPKGDVVASGSSHPMDGAIGFSWDVPAATAGGEYTVKVSHPYTGDVPGVRKFDIRAYRAPRLKSQIVFVRDGYGPGDTVSASVHVDRAEGGVPAGAKVSAIARVDGAEVANVPTTIDDKGNGSAQFKLPATIARGEGSLAFVIEDGGVVETASKTIPILLQTVDLSMYPEGGDLVAGVPNRVYLEAFTPAKKPADLAGVITDGKGAEVAAFATAHEGRGRFSFTPAKGESYTLRINQPAGIKTTYPLPAVKDSGIALQSADDVIAAGQPIRVSLAATAPGVVKVVLSKREVELATSHVRFVDRDGPSSGPPTAPVNKPYEITLTPTDDADGVLTVTAWDVQRNVPIAERLVFRKPAKSIKVDVKPDKSSYTPGAPVKLTVTTTDAAGKPVPAVVGLTATDDSVLELIEKREQAPRLPVMVLLESDVKDLADAHVYLDGDNPQAPVATDLLLGTQGWRRFATIKTEDFVKANGEAARRVLAMRVVTRREADKAMRRGGVVDGFAAAAAAIPEPVGAAAAPQDAAPAPVARPPAAVAAPAEPAAVEAVAARPAEAQVAIPAAPASPPVPAQQGQPQAAGKLQQALEVAEGKENRELFARDDAGDGVFGGRRRRQQRQDFVVVREYAHAVREGRKPDDRVDFTETLFWHAGVRTDAATGQATVSFATSDAVTAFRVFADAYGATGSLGSSSSTIESVKPFYVEMKMPLEVTQGDVIDLRTTLVNAGASPLAGARLTPRLPKGFEAAPFDAGQLEPGQRLAKVYRIAVGDVAGEFDLTFDATAGEFADKVTRKLVVKPRGFPIEFARGGMLGANKSVSYEIDVPQGVVIGSTKSELALYPTPLANLTQALEALIQSPSGCFEQTSSTCYPLVMAQQYFMSHQGVDPKIIERSRTLLDEGYAKLVGFECKTTKGFEWFGADPGHDALSAYGLLEFTDMALVRQVDPRLLKDTREFLLKSRDGKGGFARKTHTLHTWIADPECANGYNTWALLECGTDRATLAPEIDWVKSNLAGTKNSYALALGANIMSLAGDAESAKAFMTKLAGKQSESGMVDGATTSVIGSGGDALRIEATALAALAWMRDPNFAGNVERSMKWLCEACKAGRFGSTQSTILSLRAIVTYDKLRARPKAPGTAQVVVDGKSMGSPIAFGEKSQGAIKLQDVSEMLSPGKHTISLKMADGAEMPFSIAVRYNALKPATSDRCKVAIETKLREVDVHEGSLTEAVVTVTNKADEVIPTPIAIVGIPGGLEVRHDQLKELVKQQKIAAYEVIGREVVLYWRSLKANERVELPISLTASIGGSFTAPASRAYLYYIDEHKHWAEPLAAKVAAK